MNYKNGRVAKDYDHVIVSLYGKVTSGVISECKSEGTGVLSVVRLGGYEGMGVRLDQCYHAEDAFAACETRNKAREENQRIIAALNEEELDRQAREIFPYGPPIHSADDIFHPATPCCGYRARKELSYPVQWNKGNEVVQCHHCGEKWVPDGNQLPIEPKP